MEAATATSIADNHFCVGAGIQDGLRSYRYKYIYIYRNVVSVVKFWISEVITCLAVVTTI